MTDESKALERVGPQTTLTTERLTVNQIEDAFKEYLELQNRLDKLMPDEIMKIGKKKFRKKGYWRMVKKWARLTVEIVKEERIETGSEIERPDWGYLITARVTTPDGQSEDGDGSCMASEKNVYKKDWDTWRKNGSKGPPGLVKDKDGQPELDYVETAKNATVHNVRAHAITRAKNRAISDLVGFGEVSAEEINQDREEEKPKPNPQQRTDAETKNPPPENGRNYNRGYTGKEGDPTVDIPAVFKVAPKSGKSLIYTVPDADGKDIVFPIGHVRSFFDGRVEVTGWIADKKIESGDLAPELVREQMNDHDSAGSDANNPPPYGDEDVPF